MCGPNADQIYSLFGGTASHASPPTPFPGGGGALLREPYAPPNGRFRIDIRAAREYDSLLAPRPEKSIKKNTFFTPVPNADQAATSCTSPFTAAAGCHVVGTIVGHKKVLARRGRRFAMTEIEGRRSQGVPRRVLPTFEGEKTGGENAQVRFLGWPPLPSLVLPVVPGGHVTAHWPCSPPPPPRNGDRRKRSPLEKHAKTRQKRTPHRGKLPGELRAPLQCARDGALVAPHRPLSNATAPPRNGAGRRRSPRET